MSDANTAPGVASLRHPVVELLARYRAVLAAAWAARQELAGPHRLADEAAFLPAALAIQDTPVHPSPRRAMWVIMTLAAVALTWSIVGQVDIVAIAPGRIVVSDRTKVVQPLEAGVIRAIHVRDGDKVGAGQLLIELDPTLATADRKGVEEQRRSAEQDAERAQALLRALRSSTPPVSTDPTTRAQLLAEWGDIAARTARLDAEAARRQAEIRTVQELVAKLEATLPIARQREADIKTLGEQGFVSGHAGQDRTRERIEIERDLAAQRARLLEAEASLVESQRTKAAYLAETQRNLSDREAKAGLDAGQLRQQGAKTLQREQMTKLVAPVSGTVQQLAVYSSGGVVTPAQTLMVIVPDRDDISAEVAIDNKDIGFVTAGQITAVKVDTFAFTRYGTVPAEVVRVSSDAVNDEKRGLIFPATLSLKRQALNIEGKEIRLAAGMAITAEITTGHRRVIDFLLDPILSTKSESLGER